MPSRGPGEGLGLWTLILKHKLEQVLWLKFFHCFLLQAPNGGPPFVGDGQGSLACGSPWGRKELDTTE